MKQPSVGPTHSSLAFHLPRPWVALQAELKTCEWKGWRAAVAAYASFHGKSAISISLPTCLGYATIGAAAAHAATPPLMTCECHMARSHPIDPPNQLPALLRTALLCVACAAAPHMGPAMPPARHGASAPKTLPEGLGSLRTSRRRSALPSSSARSSGECVGTNHRSRLRARTAATSSWPRTSLYETLKVGSYCCLDGRLRVLCKLFP